KAEGQSETVPVGQAKIDEHYLSSFGISLATGRGFREGSPADSTSIILNENAAKIFGWTPEEALGKYILYAFPQKLEVIGVVKDFHFRSLHAPITPMMFLALNSNMWGDQRVVAVKFKTEDVSRLMASIERKWKELAPTAPVEMQFYDEVLARQYQSEQQLGRLFAVFACFSIGVGIIGLIGLVAYSAEQRKKEIGIRKVFGASITRIFVMINSQYIRFIVVALILATPFAWWGMTQWLDSFAYHIEITPFAFIAAAIAELVLAVICVGYLSLRAATLSPAVVLKDE
ncbi:MAG TPA: FtsX-like permease family protein, partial [Cyclobacteriaceae bacterium]|nr:FtsX-like permease family protein [Cyclobacteriaceae bacterium]